MCEQAGAYHHLVAPVCKSVLVTASNFFEEFPDLYTDIETFVENIDFMVDSTNEIVQGFSLTAALHAPVTKQAELNK